jgi:ribosome-binding factor A
MPVALRESPSVKSSHPRRGGRRPSDTSSSFHPQPGRAERKLAQLCRQAHERIELVLAGDLSDPNLEGLWVLDVSPEPGGTALLVTLVAPDEAPLRAVEASLEAVRGLLRSEVAADITRKRTPHLRLVVIPERALRVPQGGTHE